MAERWDEERCLGWVADCLHWRGVVLHGNRMHWCQDWDGLPVDETTPEWSGCLLSTALPSTPPTPEREPTK